MMNAQPVARWSAPHRQVIALVGVAFLLLGMAAGAAARPEMPADCALADAALSARVRALMASPDPNATWTLGYLQASAKLARGFCLGRTPERGVGIYRRVTHELDARAPVEMARYPWAQLP